MAQQPRNMRGYNNGCFIVDGLRPDLAGHFLRRTGSGLGAMYVEWRNAKEEGQDLVQPDSVPI